MRPIHIIPLIATLGTILVAAQAYFSLGPQIAAWLDFVPAPALTGRTLADAEQLADAEGLAIFVAGRRPSENAERDTVVAQTPRPGARVRRGDPMALTLSDGLRPPSVIGELVDEARDDLLRAGWRVAEQLETRRVNGAPPNVVLEQRPGPEEAVLKKGEVTLVVAMRDVALAKRVEFGTHGQALEATDGREETVAWLPAGPPRWLEVDFGGPTAVASVELLLALPQPGPVALELWAWGADGQFRPLHLFTGEHDDGAVLSVHLEQRTTDVVRLRVAVTSVPGSLGLREIRVFDR